MEFSGYDMLSERPKCEFCNLEATHERLVADASSRGFNLNEPGARIQKLCFVHAADCGDARTWRIEE